MKRLKIGVIALALAILSPFGAKVNSREEAAIISVKNPEEQSDGAASQEPVIASDKELSKEKREFVQGPQETTGKIRFTEDPQAMEQAAGSVVMLEVFDGQGKKLRTGSGFCAFEPGLLVTAAHVITNMDYAIATCDNGDTFRVDHAISADEESDVAVCAIPEDVRMTPLEAATEEPLRGEKVAATGSQFGVVNLITLGNVCGSFEMTDATWILFTAPVSSGNSGGPILNDEGKVIGITAGAYDKGQNMNLAAPISAVKKLILEINSEVE